VDPLRSSMADPEQDHKNRELIEALRKTLETALTRLTPEIEPAIVYVIKEDAA
jgi:hypothetical protein